MNDCPTIYPDMLQIFTSVSVQSGTDLRRLLKKQNDVEILPLN